MELPQKFILRTKDLLGEEWEAFEMALQTEPLTCIRLNPSKFTLLEYISENQEPSEKCAWASHAYYLTERPSFTLDPLFHAGCYYVQEASSMFLENLIKTFISKPVKVLDLCAAPGGKSTQLASVLPEKSLLVANEVIRSRAHILTENLIKWGNPYTVVVNNDPAIIGQLKSFFDVVVADVPCSGEGMFRKDPQAIQEWSVNNVQLCAERQRRIIADVWAALKPGGLLIYSTCTYNKEENENNIAWICSELGAKDLQVSKRFLPHKTKGEGFFIAAVRKEGGDGTHEIEMSALREAKEIRGKRKNSKGSNSMKNDKHASQFIQEMKTWIRNPDEFVLSSDKQNYFAFPSVYQCDYQVLKEKLNVLSAGITLGEVKGADVLPAHALAMSQQFEERAFPQLHLDKESALRYLRKESLQAQDIPSNLPKGYVLVLYQNHPLGFIKNIGNRANNLYPQEYRIRMQLKG